MASLFFASAGVILEMLAPGLLFPAAAAAFTAVLLELVLVIAPGLSSWELGLTESRGLGEAPDDEAAGEEDDDSCVIFR